MGELLNLVGLGTGVVLYAMLLAMVVRGVRTPAVPSHVDSLLLVMAALGLVWNFSALPAYQLPKLGIQGPFPFLNAVGFSALGFLPAVVVHSVLRGRRQGVSGRLKWPIAAVAYAVSAVAAVLHFVRAFVDQPVPSPSGMQLLTYAFVLLILPLAAVTRGQPGSRRALWAAALATFAVSALHLSQLHPGDASWPVELLGHHASVPLAFAILYQDYPFALADLFLKRALTLLALVTLAFVGIVLVGFRFPPASHVDPRHVGVLVTLSVATALLYPVVRRRLAWFVDRVILHRPDYRSLRAEVGRRVQTHDGVSALLDEVCGLLAPALSARSVEWHERPADGRDDTAGAAVFSGPEASALAGPSARAAAPDDGPGAARPLSVAAAVLVPTTEAPRFVVAIGELAGGRRLLSDDLATLEAIAVLVARRIDAIRITAERFEREIREREIATLVSEAELRALRAQVNPHFLFNALTTIGYLIQAAPPRALETLMRLTALLRAVLRSDGEFTTLGRELEVVASYLDIERERFEQRLRVAIDVPASLREYRVPSLVLQPIVENAVKHGIAPQRLGGEVRVSAALDPPDGPARCLVLVVRDTGAGATAASLDGGRRSGVGLNNVERRLACQYGADASLSIRSVPGQGTWVEIRLPLEAASRLAPELQEVGR
jgi:hypothetical protein